MIGWVVLAVAGVLAALFVFARVAYGRTAHGMAASGKAQALEALLAREPKAATVPDDQQEQPIHRAAAHGHADVIAVLLEHGASPNARCNGGGTPLSMAAFFGGAEAARRLIAAGADVDDCDDTGMTALHAAVAQGNTELMSVLIEAGAQLDLKDGAGRSALDVADHFEHAELAKLLSARGARRGSQVRMRDLRPPKSAGGMHRVPEALALPTGSPGMQQAQADAQATLPELKELFARQARVAVKGPVDPNTPDEKMWLGVEKLDEKMAGGFLLSNPLQANGKPGAAVGLALAQVEDWLAELPDGSLRGGHGLKAMFAHAQEEYGALPASYTALVEKLPR